MVIGSLSPWCEREYYNFLSKNNFKNFNTSQMKYITKNSTKESRKRINDLINYSSIDLPAINDPFSLKEECFESILKILK